MTSASGWKNLPNLITNDIMLMAGLGSLQDLHKCRQVCQSWNVMMSQMTKYKKDKIKFDKDDQKVHTTIMAPPPHPSQPRSRAMVTRNCSDFFPARIEPTYVHDSINVVQPPLFACLCAYVHT